MSFKRLKVGRFEAAKLVSKRIAEAVMSFE